MKYVFLFLFLFSVNFAISSDYLVTENITIYSGENYNGWSNTGQYTRTLRSSTGTDSTVITNLSVNVANIVYYFSVTPSSLKTSDKVLYELYLKYCNTVVLDTVKLIGYSIIPLVKIDGKLTQQIVFNSRNNYNQYKYKRYKNVPVTETRVPTFTGNKIIHYTYIIYHTLQRQASIDDFYASLDKLPIFGTVPSQISIQDRLLYQQYLIYCNKMSLDSVKIVGYKTVPLVEITTLNGKFLTQNIVVNSRNNYNQYRFKKYKNIPSTETRVPTFPSGKVAHWITIQYYVLQRKSSIDDFNNWYLKLAVKP